MGDAEYGIDVANKFDLGEFGDEGMDPSELLAIAIAQKKKEAEKLAKKKKDDKRLAKLQPKVQPQPEPTVPVAKDNRPRRDFKPNNLDKENRPANAEFRGRGRGGPRGARGPRGAGGPPQGDRNLPPRLAHMDTNGHEAQGDRMGDRFGESGGPPRGRGGMRGARGGPRGRAGFEPRGRGRGGNFNTNFDGPRESSDTLNNEETRGVDNGGMGVFGEDDDEKQQLGGPPRQDRANFGRGGSFARGRGRGGSFESRGGPRGMRGAPRGGGRGRDFDRHSGSDNTGIKATEKKDGFGKGNWGTTEDELAAETEPVNVTVNSDPDADKEEKVSEPAEPLPPAEPPVFTLEEYYAKQQADKSGNKPTFKIRIAGEGEKEDKKQRLVPLEKDLNVSDDSVEYIVEHKESKKRVLPINITFTNEPKPSSETRGRGGPRGGRGGRNDMRGGRGGGPRGGGQSYRGGQSRGGSEYTMDMDAFPALS